nr:glycerol-3-phosphate acyltransferase [Lactobacillus colini]
MAIWSLLVGYFFGNFLFAMIIGKGLLHKDPTKFGSANPGTANMGAVLGKKWGILTCVGDLAKTLTALFIVYFVYHQAPLAIAWCGLGLVLGHSFPFWNHFNGGKGVAVSAQWIVFFNWRAGFTFLLVALILVIFMKNLTIPPLVYMLGYSIYVWLLMGWQCGLIFLLGMLVMIFKFRKDIIDFFTGQGKRVDILTTIKKKIKV